MVFIEKFENEKWNYQNEDFYGVVKLSSDNKLDHKTLDSCVLRLMKGDLIKGTFKDKKTGNEIYFEFEKKENWFDDEEELTSK